MMIRINLLPVRQVKKREAGRQFLVALAGFAVVALVGNGVWYVLASNERDKQQQKLRDTQARIDQLRKVIGEVDNLNKRRGEVQEKLKVLDDLRKKRGGPVRLLDALAEATPKKAWLSSFEESGEAAKLIGQAESLDEVSELMRGLNNVVWTPRGLGRVVEVKRDGSRARVELMGDNATIEDFPANEVGHFFSNIELKSTQAKGGQTSSRGPGSLVSFELSLSVNYAI